jgi:hypothetical protein
MERLNPYLKLAESPTTNKKKKKKKGKVFSDLKSVVEIKFRKQENS